MKRPRLRITVRWMLVAVAMTALGSWWFIARRVRFERLAAYHDIEADKHLERPPMEMPGRVGPLLFLNARGKWHSQLAAKCAEAAAHPWWPVGPDPAPPD